MTCRTVRKITAATSAAFWGAAVLLALLTPDDGRTNLVLLLVAAGAASAVCCIVGYLLSKGSAEQVWQLGYEAGWKAAENAHVDGARGGNVVALQARRGVSL